MGADEPARHVTPEATELELLGNELSFRRGMHVSLAPDGDGIPVLEVVSDLPGPMRSRRISWRDGSFWLMSVLRVPRTDISYAADWVAAELGWTRSMGFVRPRGCDADAFAAFLADIGFARPHRCASPGKT